MKLLFNLVSKTFSPVYDEEALNELPEHTHLVEDEEVRDSISASITGNGCVWEENGKLCYSGKAPNDYSIFDKTAKKWTTSEEKIAEQLQQQKENLLGQLANKADELKSSLLVGYPQTEIESFYRQEKEALSWKEDKNASTPMLIQIAKLRGVPFELLVEKVLEKSAQFAVVIGIIIGQRQAFEDKLLTIKTSEELTTLEQEISEWQLPSLS